MIAGCYSLDLYCENSDHKSRTWPDKHGHAWGEFPHQYTDERGSVCRAMARKAGWKLDRRAGTALCPKCNPASPRFVKVNP